MLIAVVSDTHRNNKYINIASKMIKEADILIHLGDNSEDVEELTKEFTGKVYAVRGNCDASNKYPKEQLIEVEGKKIFFTHGDLYGVKYNLNTIYYRGIEVGADIVLFGHTHQNIVEEVNGITLMNPGSISLPYLKGRYVGLINIEKDKKVEFKLVEAV